MDTAAIERATERLRQAAEGRVSKTEIEAVLEHARLQVEALAQTADELQGALPDAVGNAVREGIRTEALPVARQIGEVRGLSNQLVRRLARIEREVTAERNERVDDLALIVDLVVTGWRSIDERLARIEEMLGYDERPMLPVSPSEAAPAGRAAAA